MSIWFLLLEDMRSRWAVYSKQPRRPCQDVEVTALLAANTRSHPLPLYRLWMWIHGAMSNHIISALFGPRLPARLPDLSSVSCIWSPQHFPWEPFRTHLQLTTSTWLRLANLSAWGMSKSPLCQQAHTDRQASFFHYRHGWQNTLTLDVIKTYEYKALKTIKYFCIKSEDKVIDASLRKPFLTNVIIRIVSVRN